MDEILKKIDEDIRVYEVLEKVHKISGNIQMETMSKGMKHEAESLKAFILSEQKESKGSVIIALSEGEYIHRCLNCNNQIMSISGSLNFCPTCGKAVEPLHMASGEIVFSETN